MTIQTKKSFTNSSQVKEIEYNEPSKEMLVTFLTGVKYVYYDITPEIWKQALEAESIGKFLNSSIKGKFRYGKI